MDLIPNNMVDLVCPFMYGCEAYDAWNQHLIIVKLSALNISGMLVVFLT